MDFRQVAAAAPLFICAMKQYGDFLPDSVKSNPAQSSKF